MRLLRVETVGEPRALLIHVTEENEGDLLPRLQSLTVLGFTYVGLEVEDWNRDLSPWTAPPVFGRVPFGGGAQGTLDFLVDDILPRFDPMLPRLLGGYSLAGLFALWAQYECDLFEGVAAASPSVWFPGWDEYADARTPHGMAYLSLGDREAWTRNRQMATVADAIRRQDRRFEAIPHTFEWNPGNHFADAAARMAKGFAWLLNR